MSKRIPNSRLVKIHRSYSLGEVSELFGVHKNTVRNWIKAGLPLVDRSRPILINGLDLAKFLTQKRKADKKRCGRGEMYCFGCRHPRSPAGNLTEFFPRSSTHGSLLGYCPECGSWMRRLVSRAHLHEFNVQEGAQERAPSATSS